MSEANRNGIIIPVSLAESLREGLEREEEIYRGIRIENPPFMRSVINRIRSCLKDGGKTSDGYISVLKLRSGDDRFFKEIFDKLEGSNGRNVVEKLLRYLNKSISAVCQNALEESGNRLSGEEFERMLTRLLEGDDEVVIRTQDFMGRRTEAWFRTEGLKILKRHMPPEEADFLLDLLLIKRDPQDKKFGSVSCCSLTEALKLFKFLKSMKK